MLALTQISGIVFEFYPNKKLRTQILVLLKMSTNVGPTFWLKRLKKILVLLEHSH